MMILLRPHFAKDERLSGAKSGTERVHWGAIEGVSMSPTYVAGP